MTISVTVWIILGGAILTYATRFGGHVILSLFPRIHPRVQAALDAVPAAVLTTLVAPAVVGGSFPEIAALCVSALVGLRTSAMPMFFAGAITVIALRNLM